MSALKKTEDMRNPMGSCVEDEKETVDVMQELSESIMCYSDRPIFTGEEDALNRRYFAEHLSKALVNFNSSDTFTIGLYGRWGSGKTSLVNMMLEEIEKKQTEQGKYIIVKFEPWNFSDTNQLLEQFFVHLINTFLNSKDKKMQKIGEALEKYSNTFEVAKVIPHFGGFLAIIGKKGAKELGKKLQKGFDEKDALKQKEVVINLLRQQEKRVLIVIDDIDRLDDEQIRQVFQLITSVAKFPNITYLLVFDKEIVVKALEKVQEGSGEDYLEKIIQMPIQIPDIHKSELRKVLFDRLDRIIASFEGVMFDQVHWAKMFESSVEPLLEDLRDINRLCNSFQFKLLALAAEVDFTDLLVVSAIEIVHPCVYEWIKTNKPILTGEFDYSTLTFENKTQKDQYEYYLAEIGRNLNNESRKYENEKEAKKVVDILSSLFPYFGNKIGNVLDVYDSDSFRKNNRIAHPDKFERYFYLNLGYIELKSSQIANAIFEMKKEELCAFIVELDKNYASYEFLQEIKAAAVDVSSSRAKTIIAALFECASLLDMISNKSIFHVSARDYAEQLVLFVFSRIDAEERRRFLEEQISNSNIVSLPTIASVINMEELAYGRLSANGVEREFEKVITLDELIIIEKLFSERVKVLLNKYSIFDFVDYRMIMHLMECFESGYIEEHIEIELQKDINVLKYLKSIVFSMIGSGVRYEVSDEYRGGLNKERILEAIEKTRLTKELFDLPLDNRRLCAAFFLKYNGIVDYAGRVTQEDVDKLLNDWMIGDKN